MSTSAEAIMHVPSYADWLSKQNPVEAYRYEKKLLLLLQWQRNGGFWVLKSPHHLGYLQNFISVFPATKVVWMHRQLEQCVPSFLSMLYYSRSMFTKNVDQEIIKAHWLPKLKNMLLAGQAFDAQHSDKVLDVYFSDFMHLEKSVLREVMMFLKEGRKKSGTTESADQKNFRSRHRYTLQDWGLNDAIIQKEFDFYDKSFFNSSKIQESL
jgi:hypothetical protein